MSLKISIINKAIHEAKKSKCAFKVGSVIFNKKKIISVGHNHSQRSVRRITKKFIKKENSIHAEVCAIINARQNLKGCSILVIRINNKDEMRLSKPCEYCQNYLEFVGIRDIYYSTEEGIQRFTLLWIPPI